jgi:CheY-like chemotaxis protein
MSHDKKHLIYVIDDNPMNLLLTSKILESYGFETQTAESGAAALQLIRQQRPSLILLDINMPNMDGYEVCRRIKAKEDWAVKHSALLGLRAPATPPMLYIKSPVTIVQKLSAIQKYSGACESR